MVFMREEVMRVRTSHECEGFFVVAIHQYNLIPTDRTHLNWVGSVVFGNLVASLIEESAIRKKVEDYIRVDKKIVKAIQKGIFIFPEVGPAPVHNTTTPV